MRITQSLLLIIFASICISGCYSGEGWYAPCDKNDDCGSGETYDGSVSLECISTVTIRDPLCTTSCQFEKTDKLAVGTCVSGEYDSANESYTGQCWNGCCMLTSVMKEKDQTNGKEYIHGWCVPGL